jgi:hypothetical protein
MLVRIIVGFCGYPLDVRGYLIVGCGCRSGIQHPQSADADMTLTSNGADLPQPIPSRTTRKQKANKPIRRSVCLRERLATFRAATVTGQSPAV